MPLFCDVALPVPLDSVFTYRVDGVEPVVGGRVLVPFRNQRLAGVVTALHDNPPKVETKRVVQVLDAAPVLDEPLRRLGQWIADYYLAPLGEVFRSMLPLGAEVRHARQFRITPQGWEALHQGAEVGATRRSRRTEDEQAEEYRVLNYLSLRDGAREETVRAATRAGRGTLDALLRKKWVTAEDVSAARDATRTVPVAQLKEVTGKLNDNQRALVETLVASGGRARVELMRQLDVPRTTLGTLVRRGVVEMLEEPEEFRVSAMAGRPLDFPLNASQQAALKHIQAAAAAGKFSVTLLHGVTGSGKTAVYLSAMKQALAAGRGALLLVPEIGLTPAAAANLAQVFGEDVAILHSALTPAERAEQWHRIRRGDARIVVGTRSAVFAPVRDLALIVVDEEHDSSYKQEETPRYHGRDVAVMRGKLERAAVVLSSATPALESFHNAKQGKYAHIELRERVEQRPLPEVELVDMRQEFQQTGAEQVISRRLAEEIADRLARNEQVMVLLNRRGFSALVLCRSCGDSVQCRNCAIALTYHKAGNYLECHMCGYRERVPKTCPKCGSEYIFFVGSGSEKLEALLHAQFPKARIARLDRDTVRGRDDFERVLGAFDAGEFDILVGTQMIAKGHDIHGVTLVGVVGADFALSFPDFRAAERTFQLLTQVAGRAGRGTTPGKVVLQTYFPDHYAIQFATKHDYDAFSEKEMRYRSWMSYPPYSALANVLVRSEKLEEALRISGALGRWLEKTPHPGVRVMGPAAAPLARLKREFRFHFILKAQSRQKLNGLLRALLAEAAGQKISRANLVVDVDAVSLL